MNLSKICQVHSLLLLLLFLFVFLQFIFFFWRYYISESVECMIGSLSLCVSVSFFCLSFFFDLWETLDIMIILWAKYLSFFCFFSFLLCVKPWIQCTYKWICWIDDTYFPSFFDSSSFLCLVCEILDIMLFIEMSL